MLGVPHALGAGSAKTVSCIWRSGEVANKGWGGNGCSVSNEDAAKMEEITRAVVDSIPTETLRLTVEDNMCKPYLQMFLNMTRSFSVTTEEVRIMMEAVATIISNDHLIKDVEDMFDHDKMELAASILAKCLELIYDKDCFVEKDQSRVVYNRVTLMLDKLSVLQIWGKSVSTGNYTLQTELFEVFSTRVFLSESSQLHNRVRQQTKSRSAGE